MDEFRWYSSGVIDHLHLLRKNSENSLTLVWIQPNRLRETTNQWHIKLWLGSPARGSDRIAPIEFTGTLDEAKAVGLAMYRMQGGG